MPNCRTVGGQRNWHKLATLDPWVLGVLARLRDLIVAMEAQLAELQTELLARVKDEVAPKGLGGLTLAALDGEVCDWHRFNNRKQVGSYTGCCPGEHSSGMRHPNAVHQIKVRPVLETVGSLNGI